MPQLVLALKGVDETALKAKESTCDAGRSGKCNARMCMVELEITSALL